ncbi:sensor histidine kinase [Mucilaginibacter segetis]|uniref:histidine kinase n=1 Tax=Mucilaginibacter segetis TaxID=2793071 RepID=A0A934PUU3_9SPHI|nr:sensor histidine kinase [Mucilaginibacter segetis]MBK0379952.1 sensor histidine kinase [Mucilaginibacter segetis]
MFHIIEIQELYIVLILGILLFALLAAFILHFIILYKNKQLTHKQEQEQLKSNFRQELLKARNEIQEQTLLNISREIHDNITQVLSFVKLNLAMTGDLDRHQQKERIGESRMLVAQAISDLRDLSKSISFEHISQLGLVKTIEIEIERISKSGIIKVALSVEGDVYTLGDKRELVLFRIFQEALNNTLKHSKASFFKISLQYSELLFNLTIEDDGIGFTTDTSQKGGSGLKNMENRAALIGAVATINSMPGKGCCIKITIDPFIQQAYADGNDSYSSG